MSQIIGSIPASGPGSGTVTSISAGTGITLTPNPIVATGVVGLTIPVSIANGGTNAITMANVDGVVYYDGTKLVTTAVGTATNVLTSNGAGLAPTFQAAPTSTTDFNSIVIQKFTGNGTYTPTSGMKYCIIECVGGGGGGGGASTAGGGFAVGAGGGGGGGYARKISTAAAIGASQTVTIGTAGTAGTAGNNAGGNGGDTSLGAICIGKGGTGGSGANGGTNAAGAGGAGGVAGTGDLTFQGQSGFGGQVLNTAANIGTTAAGGNSYFGAGAPAAVTGNAGIAGPAGISYGGGGGGGNSQSSGNRAGGAGVAGIIVITEYIH